MYPIGRQLPRPSHKLWHVPRDADDALKAEFAQKLRSAYTKAKKAGTVRSADEFARTLGFRRANLYKYFAAKLKPSSGILRRALSKWGVVVHYGGLELDESALIRGAGRRKPVPAAQMPLDLAIRNLAPGHITVAVGRKRPTSVDLRLRIGFG